MCARAVHGHVGVELLPKRVRALEGRRVASISAGPFSSGAVDASGSAWAWGLGTGYQLGTGRAANELVPAEVGRGAGTMGLSLDA